MFLTTTPGSAHYRSMNNSQQVGVSTGSFEAVQPEDATLASTRAIESVSPIAVPKPKPRKFRPNDLITVIIRQQRKYEADAEFETEKKYEIDAKLEEWLRFYPGMHLGTDNLSNGKPGVRFGLDNKYETEGSNEREDSFIMRLQATIIDVKPNGNLVIQATQTEKHDEEENKITLTGTCRSEDVTPDNSILSTQVANLVIVEENEGAIRDATSRGWVPKLLDWVHLF
jgi:flagellar L-ring protein precursor FlgH